MFGDKDWMEVQRRVEVDAKALRPAKKERKKKT